MSALRHAYILKLRRRQDRLVAGHEIAWLRPDEHGHARIKLAHPQGYAGCGLGACFVTTLDYGHLLVHGDCDTVCFAGYSPRSSSDRFQYIDMLAWLAGYDYFYAAQKARLGGSLADDFDLELARKQICAERRVKVFTAEQARALWDAADDGEAELDRKAGELNLYESSPGGLRPSWRVLTAQAVLSRAVLLLGARGIVSQRWPERLKELQAA